MKNTLIVSGIVALVVSALVLVLAPRTVEVKQLGSGNSSDLMTPWFSFGSVRQWAGHTNSLNQATTTVCAIQSPAATSTLTFAAVRFTISSSTATIINLAKATTAYATTTSLGTAPLGAGAQGTLVASTTSSSLATLDGTYTFAPSTWFVVGVQAGISAGDTAGTGFVPTGTCSARWTEI